MPKYKELLLRGLHKAVELAYTERSQKNHHSLSVLTVRKVFASEWRWIWCANKATIFAALFSPLLLGRYNFLTSWCLMALQKVSKYSSSVLSSYFVYIISAICSMITVRSWRNCKWARQQTEQESLAAFLWSTYFSLIVSVHTHCLLQQCQEMNKTGIYFIPRSCHLDVQERVLKTLYH